MSHLKTLSVKLAVICLWSVATVASAENIAIVDVGGFAFTDQSGSGASELSGITYGGGSTYFAVSDELAKLFQINIDLNLDNGAIQSAAIGGSPLELQGELGQILPGPDREGVAFAGTSIFIADENGPQISQHDLTTGRRLSLLSIGSDPQLSVYSNTRDNRGWESLARRTDGSEFWTANEEALSVDGDLATTTTGTVVRLQKFDGNLKPIGRWAYETDPIGLNFGTGFETSGVVDLVALDHDRLLVMERAVANGLRIRIYLAEGFDQATDISAGQFDGGLVNQNIEPLTKTLLFEKVFLSNANFEGLTLGPTLNTGHRSLVLVADNGSGSNHFLYALRLVPEPSTATWIIGLLFVLCRSGTCCPTRLTLRQ